jgi:hypothetical protein
MVLAFELLGFLLFVAMMVAFYVWTRRTESDMDFEQSGGMKSAEQADALRLGIAINASNSNNGGH